jgi:hypothetical protein
MHCAGHSPSRAGRTQRKAAAARSGIHNSLQLVLLSASLLQGELADKTPLHTLPAHCRSFK